ncbi:saccharopine dehydrogenase-like protein [Collimonas sp. PA-H2]|uniref:saccharopine dehydrogenase NADP-binding domain-containing protein n=1 Tax=Collimonas sp. PA-H2 TaxID=1881062 RepID=UPI000C001FF3|nr:saccharopine dehydrogenase NADP-binding domain-containing protein [Collimonas sp. PA-H2]PFH11784.1 saccharopine dehydrogenase-like protein [Collimonas sp. PA-H2]
MSIKLILIGAGNIGDAILNLSRSRDYILTVADRDPQRLEYAKQAGFPNITTILADISHAPTVTKLISGHDVTLPACPHFLTPVIATAAKAAHSHYFDLTEDVESTCFVKSFAQDSTTACVPQCGLGTLRKSWQGRIQNLDYKTVRYPGHRDIIKILVRDLRLGKLERRPILKEVLETSIPIAKQDVVLTLVRRNHIQIWCGLANDKY